MKQKRRSIFETNSSSTHAINIIKSGTVIIPTKLSKTIPVSGYFGWEHEIYNDWYSKLSYLRIAIEGNSERLEKDYYETLIRFLRPLGVEEVVIVDVEGSYSYIDHCNECISFIRGVLKDNLTLYRYLFCEDSFIETGNDNEETELKNVSKRKYEKYYKGN